MPPRYQQTDYINFYRPCWNAYERGPPRGKREGPKYCTTLLYYKIHLSHLLQKNGTLKPAGVLPAGCFFCPSAYKHQSKRHPRRWSFLRMMCLPVYVAENQTNSVDFHWTSGKQNLLHIFRKSSVQPKSAGHW